MPREIGLDELRFRRRPAAGLTPAEGGRELLLPAARASDETLHDYYCSL